MKKILIVVFAFSMITGMATTASASYAQGTVDPARFFVVDDNSDPSPNGNDSVTLSGFGNLPANWSLEYSLDGTSWTVADLGGITITTGPDENDDWELVYFRIVDDPDNVTQIDDSANLTFFNPEGDLWNSVRMDWDESDPDNWYTEFSFLGAEGDDNVAPVPIAPSVVLLGSGLFGLLAFGYRRRSAQE